MNARGKEEKKNGNVDSHGHNSNPSPQEEQEEQEQEQEAEAPRKRKKNKRVRVNFDLWQDQDKEEEEEKAAELQKLKDELEGVGKDDSGKTEEEKMEDEAYELMMKMYQLLLYACCAVAWLYVLLRALLDLLAGGDVWESVGHVALFLQLTGWVRSPARCLPRRTVDPRH